MPRGEYRKHETKKPKKSKQKILLPAQILPHSSEPERIVPKRRPEEEEEEEEEKT